MQWELACEITISCYRQWDKISMPGEAGALYPKFVLLTWVWSKWLSICYSLISHDNVSYSSKVADIINMPVSCILVFTRQCMTRIISNKKLSYRKETVRLLYNIEIRIVHKSHIVLIGLFRSNRYHRLTFRRVIIEKWMYTAQVPMNNALVLSNLCEYRHKWYIAKN